MKKLREESRNSAALTPKEDETELAEFFLTLLEIKNEQAKGRTKNNQVNPQ